MKNKINVNNKFLKDDSKLKIAIDYIKNTDFSKLKDGKISITDSIWANLQTYITKTDALFEAHRKYIDVQYIIEGIEYIGVSEYTDCVEEIKYNDENDIEFLRTNNNQNIEMLKGDFLILYPTDAHKPSVSINEPTKVRKLVVKIPID